MHVHESKYGLGQTVYFRNAEERKPGTVVGICFTADGGMYYRVAWQPGLECSHYEAELTDTWVPDFARGADAGEDAEERCR